MKLSPIALFVYNRPVHSKKVLDALYKNKEAKNSFIFIFCDGYKSNISFNQKSSVLETREIVLNENRFKNKTVIQNEFNKGLANSIIDGVNYVLERFDSVIVLEDDILPEKGFLKYMNEALNLYKYDEKVGCIHAWNYTFKKNFIKQNTFFLKGADCWGWGTWKNSWDLFEKDGNELLRKFDDENQIYSFNRNGTHPFFDMLIDQIEGKNNSWAIRWHASLFLSNKYCLHPKYSLVVNIGLDGSGSHCGNEQLIQKTINNIKIKKITVVENLDFFKSYKKGIKKISLWDILKVKLTGLKSRFV